MYSCKRDEPSWQVLARACVMLQMCVAAEMTGERVMGGAVLELQPAMCAAAAPTQQAYCAVSALLPIALPSPALQLTTAAATQGQRQPQPPSTRWYKSQQPVC